MNDYTVRVKIDPKEILSLFVSAFEGGSNYWLRFVDVLKSEFPPVDKKLVAYGQDHLYEGYFEIRLGYDSPKNEDVLEYKVITPHEVLNGLEIMASQYPFHFGNILNDDADGVTGDVFLQCVLFGDVIYS